jgi:hypothetical protein
MADRKGRTDRHCLKAKGCESALLPTGQITFPDLQSVETRLGDNALFDGPQEIVTQMICG